MDVPKKTAMLIDTGPRVAFFDKDDRYHFLCLEILEGEGPIPPHSLWALQSP